MSEPRWKDLPIPRPAEVEPEATSRVLRVPGELAGTRLDVFLRLSLRSTSRTRAKRIAKAAAFSPEGQRLRPNQRLKAEEHVVLWRMPVDGIDEAIELPAIYQDEHLLVVNKPPDITVHPTASHYHNTVLKLLEHRTPDQYFSLIHRLDRDTSGVLLIGLSSDADRAFKRLLEGTIDVPAGIDPNVQKTYRAITWGVPPDGDVLLPVEADPTNSLRVKMRIANPGEGLASRTHVRVLERCEGYALVECKLFTGRQHQIRVHLAALGTPVVGDKLYGPDERMHARAADRVLSDEDRVRLEHPRQALHAYRYELPHAVTWQPLNVVAPLPEDLQQFWLRVSGRLPQA